MIIKIIIETPAHDLRQGKLRPVSMDPRLRGDFVFLCIGTLIVPCGIEKYPVMSSRQTLSF